MIEEASQEALLLAEVDILEGLPQSEIGHLAERSASVRLSRKRDLDLGGDRRSIILVLSGRVRVYQSILRGLPRSPTEQQSTRTT